MSLSRKDTEYKSAQDLHRVAKWLKKLQQVKTIELHFQNFFQNILAIYFLSDLLFQVPH
jgi:hypothetical protein